MSPRAAWDKRLIAGWREQRDRVDAWEASPYPELEWREVREFLRATASALGAIVGTPNELEQELIRLLGSYLSSEAAMADHPAGEIPEDTWTTFRRSEPRGPFVEMLGRLHAYAVIGTWADDDLPDQQKFFVERVRSEIATLQSVLARMPRDSEVPRPRSSSLGLQSICDIAEARLAVDEGITDAPVVGLAWLGGVMPKTVQNMLSKQHLKSGATGTVEPRSARSWLSAREWRRSCWREAIDVISGGLAAPFQDIDRGEQIPLSEEAPAKVDWMFVPRAADGTLFTPDLVRTHGWTVGPRGRERPFGDYWRALAFLAESESPCWRRPNEAGAYNLVIGKEWIRISRTELELQLKAAEARRRRL